MAKKGQLSESQNNRNPVETEIPLGKCQEGIWCENLPNQTYGAPAAATSCERGRSSTLTEHVQTFDWFYKKLNWMNSGKQSSFFFITCFRNF